MSASDSPFAPDWASPPGETILDLLDEKDLTRGQLAARLSERETFVDRLITGEAELTDRVARVLEEVLGASTRFWIAREDNYRREIARLDSSVTESDWAQRLPWKEMVAFGWLHTDDISPQGIARAAFNYFGVRNLSEWRTRYGNVATAAGFRRSTAFAAKTESTAVWLRQGEIIAAQARYPDWDADRFRAKLSYFRGLTRISDPAKFIPELTAAAMECGVCVAIVRAPTGCPVSGAARFLSPQLALIQLSFRYLSDDHFWFTFFHEAGHLLLHGHTTLHLEGSTPISHREEDEANAFAGDILVPPAMRPAMMALPLNGREVVRFATKLGIAPGIVVGQMQHASQITRRQLNELKRRYAWPD